MFANPKELFVFLNGHLQVDSPLQDYQSLAPNSFTFNAIPPGLPVIIAFILTMGTHGLKYRETFLNQGPFPGNVVTVATLDNDLETILVFLNGKLQSINYDYIITGPNTIRFIKTVLGATHTVEVVGIAASHPAKWRT
jgi:hypothetical protein